MKTLVLAEKPSVARDIAKVLHCTKHGANFIEGENYVITWAVGHLIKLQDPDQIDEKYKKWRLEDLPILPNKIPLSTIANTKTQFSAVKKLMNSNDISDIICATDAGREGELIFRLIYEYAQCQKPFKRLWISSLTDESIVDGFKKLKDGDKLNSLYYSAICRAYADWYVGMNASRLFSIHYKTVLSIGRVQTPTLALIVNKQKEIDAFVSSAYFTVTAHFGDFDAQWFDEKNNNFKTNKQIKTKTQAEKIIKQVKGKNGTITACDVSENVEHSPLLFDLTSLQREANERFGFTAEKTLKLTQELYEKYKIVTYPRTDSRYLSQDMKAKMPYIFKTLSNHFESLVNVAQEGFKQRHLGRIFNDEKVSDHHAIIPTGKAFDLEHLPTDIKHILLLIVARFLSVFFDPNITHTKKIVCKVENEHFLAQGKTTIDLGWRETETILPSKRKKKGDLALELPQVKVGDVFMCKDVKMKEDKTKPPEQYTDSSLLSAMENAGRLVDDEELKQIMKKSGLGTPATRAAIIERLITVGYMKREKKHFVPTEKGKKLIEIAPRELTSAELTGNWELQLNDIASHDDEAKKRSALFLNDIRQFAHGLLNYKKDHSIIFEKTKTDKKSKSKEFGDCPLCGKGQILENSKAFYCSRWQENCKFTLWKDSLQKQGGPLLNADIMQVLLKDKKVQGSTGCIVLDGDKLSFEKQN